MSVRPWGPSSEAGGGLPLAVASVGFLVFYALPIRTTAYGDTRTILEWWTDNSQLSVTWLADMFKAHPLDNRPVMTQVLYRGFSYAFGVPIEQAFRIISAASGALCLALWVQFVRSEHSDTPWGPLFVLVGCGLGANQVYFGHVETYAFVSLMSFLFLMTGHLALNKKASVWLAAIVYVLALKIHPVAIYYLPAFLFLITWRLAPQVPFLQQLLTWKGVALAVILPVLVTGMGLYLFYFQSYDAPHTGISGALRQTFLPVLPPAPPLEYSLFSIAHITDLFNVILLVCTPVAVVLVAVLLLHAKAIAWNDPRVLFAALALAFPLLFFAAVNPALSMPRDWDLFSLVAGPALLFFVAILDRSRHAAFPQTAVYGTVLAFGVFSMSFWALNSSPTKLSARLEDVGEYVFRTYHTNASFILNSAYALDPDSANVLSRRIRTVERLAPDVTGEDQEYTHLLMSIATCYRSRGDERNAVLWAERATVVAPNDLDLRLWLVDHLLWANETARAQQQIETILEREPGNLSGLVLGAVAAAQEKNYAAALAFLERAGEVAPNDADVAFWTEQMRGKQTRLVNASTDSH